MSDPATPRPTAVRKDGDAGLTFDWDDGRRGSVSWADLRANCPCATCREERDKPPEPFRILRPEELVPLKAVAVTPIGYYAYKITWSDGHDSGLFTLRSLRDLCRFD